MSHALTETSTFTADVTVPDPGDDRTAASVGVPFQALTNRTKLFRDQLTGTATGVTLQSPTITGDLGMSGNITTSGEISCAGTLSTQGDAVLGSNSVDTLTVNAASTFGAAVTCNGAVVFNSSVTCNGTFTAASVVSTGQISAGGGLNTGTVQGADADATYDAATVHCVIAIAPSATRTYDIAVANNGAEIEIVNLSTINGITVRGLQGFLPGSPATLATGMISTSGNVRGIRLRRLGTNWVIASRDVTP